MLACLFCSALIDPLKASLLLYLVSYASKTLLRTKRQKIEIMTFFPNSKKNVNLHPPSKIDQKKAEILIYVLPLGFGPVRRKSRDSCGIWKALKKADTMSCSEIETLQFGAFPSFHSTSFMLHEKAHTDFHVLHSWASKRERETKCAGVVDMSKIALLRSIRFQNTPVRSMKYGCCDQSVAAHISHLVRKQYQEYSCHPFPKRLDIVGTRLGAVTGHSHACGKNK